MRCGLYGKLPCKRDFIALQTPRAFLDVWEPWIAAGVSASRQQLGAAWQNAFLTAPIWRFWLGAQVCGMAVTGAFMPSLDAVGRYFPLTLLVCADAEAGIPPPELNDQQTWFEAAEAFLLGTLDHDVEFDAIVASLDALATPSDQPADASPQHPLVRAKAMLAAGAAGQSFPAIFTDMRVSDHQAIYAAASFWWTIGGEGYEPLAMGGRGLPEPGLFADMLTGRLVTAPAFATTTD